MLSKVIKCCLWTSVKFCNSSTPSFCSFLLKDVTDLFGTDLPVEGGKGGEFAWRDGPLLAALKAGHWIVLDEVNSNLGDK